MSVYRITLKTYNQKYNILARAGRVTRQPLPFDEQFQPALLASMQPQPQPEGEQDTWSSDDSVIMIAPGRYYSPALNLNPPRKCDESVTKV